MALGMTTWPLLETVAVGADSEGVLMVCLDIEVRQYALPLVRQRIERLLDPGEADPLLLESDALVTEPFPSQIVEQGALFGREVGEVTQDRVWLVAPLRSVLQERRSIHEQRFDV